jgi:hypothetical protein
MADDESIVADDAAELNGAAGSNEAADVKDTLEDDEDNGVNEANKVDCASLLYLLLKSRNDSVQDCLCKGLSCLLEASPWLLFFSRRFCVNLERSILASSGKQ